MTTLRCTGEPPELELSGTPVELRALGGEIEAFAKRLAFEEDVPDNYHVHYEGWPGHERIAEDSVGLIILVKR